MPPVCHHNICVVCDSAIHKQQSLHDREIWSDGVFKAVPLTITCDSCSDSESLTIQCMNISMFDTYTRHDLSFLSTAGCCIPFSLPWRCPLCNEGKITLTHKQSAQIVVNLRGKCLSYSLDCLPQHMNLECL